MTIAVPRNRPGCVRTQKHRHDEFAEEATPLNEILAGVGHGLADVDEEIDEPRAVRLGQFLEAPVGDLVEQDAVLGARIDEIGRKASRAEFMARAVENPCAERIEPLDPGKVDDDPPTGRCRDDIGRKRLDHGGMRGGPVGRTGPPSPRRPRDRWRLAVRD